MLGSFQRIQGLGVFINYARSSDTVKFGVKNFIYGWKYSDKTTLSRLVAMLGSNSLNQELPQYSFTITTASGNVAEANFSDVALLRHANNIERMSEKNDLICDIEAAVGDLMPHLQTSDPDHLATLRAAVA